jgi:hypothetical protein
MIERNQQAVPPAPAELQHFRRIATKVDIRAILAELVADPNLWFVETGRQERAPAQRGTLVIPLRGLRKSEIGGRRRRDVHESRYTRLARRFPATREFMEAFAQARGGQLGRARFARLPPGKRVSAHVDRGEYYRSRDRFHLVLVSERGSLLRAGGETARLQVGELWWFDNKIIHDAENDSDRDRVHLIFDVTRPAAAQSGASLRDPAHSLAPEQLLARQSLLRAREDLADIVRAVQLYDCGRNQPQAWRALLEQAGLLADADRSPVGAVARLVWPHCTGAARQRFESVVGWCLAQLDLDRLNLAGMADGIEAAGGIDVIHRQWREQREQALYGAE